MLKSITQLVGITFLIFFLFNISNKEDVTSISTNTIIKYVNIGDVRVHVDLAQTPAEHEQGLSGRKSLSESEGLLFVFDKPGQHSFWMKDMNFPIDIIWLSRELKIVYIKHDASPLFYPQTYAPDKDAFYVLEVVAGFSEKNNLKIGDSATFTY